jgi:hypothetical protein
MALRRMLSRRISQSKKVNKLSLKAQIVWTWTIPWLDDYGCYTGDPEDIKTEVFPKNKKITTGVIREALEELVACDLVKLYSENGEIYQYYVGFNDFQTFRADRTKQAGYPQYQPEKAVRYPTDIPTTTNDTHNISKVNISKSNLIQSNTKERYSPNSNEIRLSELLFSLISERKPDYKKPNIQNWAVHIDRMIRLDNRKVENIEKVIRWCQTAIGSGKWKGWQNIILSTEKLREQFDKLEMAMVFEPPLQPVERGKDGLTAKERYLKEQGVKL